MCRIGMIGTGRIARRFVMEAKEVHKVAITCVYNPKLSSAKAFAKEYGIKKYTNQLEELIEEIDAVYVASPHQTHVAYAKEMLKAKRHVLCEKPLCFSKREAEELFLLANKQNCVLMEAIKTAYCPGFTALIDIAKSGKIGSIIDVEACFSRIPETNVREVWDGEFGGSFTEYGSYTLLPIVKLLGTIDKNTLIKSVASETCVDAYTKLQIDYADAWATAKTGLGVKSEGQLLITGTRGYILVPAPWWLTRYFEVHYEEALHVEKYEYPFEGQGLRYEIEAFVKRIEGEYIRNSVTEQEAVWIAGKMENFLTDRMDGCLRRERKYKKPNVWAHRGCSLRYPENTVSAFVAATQIDGLTGIELDVQLSKDHQIVVIHDETVDRTTNGTGYVCDYTLEELKQFEILSRDSAVERIPTLEEVFLKVQKACWQKDMSINIELKNSKIRYEGMEELLLQLVRKYGLEKHVVYSSFLPESMMRMKQLDENAQTAVLGRDIYWCIEQAESIGADAVHPWIGGLDIMRNTYADVTLCEYPIRVWNIDEPFYGQGREWNEPYLLRYQDLGVTDIITNVPEIYL